MLILGIETSCDETAAAIIEGNSKSQKLNILSNIVSSSLSFHSKTGGIIPEIAAREQLKYILPVIQKSFTEANVNYKDIDAIAVTIGPGLIGSLLVGVETAKTLAYVYKKPIISVNHLIGHLYANWLIANGKLHMEKPYAIRHKKYADIQFSALALLVSGGHTDLVLLNNHKQIKWLGGTRDDAAGEAFDKIGRLLALPYPAGPKIEELAQKGNPKAFNFPRPMIGSNNYDFSFSGLKTAVLYKIKELKKIDQQTISDLCASVQKAIIDVLVKKTVQAAQKYKVKSVLLGGGVAANHKLRTELESSIIHSKSSMKLFAPAKSLCTDNAAMIAAAAFFNYKPTSWQKITANPELYFD